MSATSEDSPRMDHNIDDRAPSSSHPTSKSEHLARVRRNQQRCRARKRAHVGELESQIEALRAKIQQCEPCEAPDRSSKPESTLETAQRENAARRDLLTRLGFDDETQQHFIHSADKRQSVGAILTEHRTNTNSPQLPSTQHTAILPLTPAYSSAPLLGPHTDRGEPEVVEPATADALKPVAPRVDRPMVQQANAPDLDMQDWLLAADNSWPPLSDNTLGDFLTYREPYNDFLGFLHDSALSVAPQRPIIPSNTRSDITVDDLGAGRDQNTAQPKKDGLALDPSVERCFLDTIVQLQPKEYLIPCSTALSLLFRYNRKGLSTAELQRSLKGGVRPPCEASGECRVEDSTLFNVLASIAA